MEIVKILSPSPTKSFCKYKNNPAIDLQRPKLAIPNSIIPNPIPLMAKSLPSSATRFQQFAKLVVSSKKPQSATPPKPKSKIRVSPPKTPIADTVRIVSEPAKPMNDMEEKHRTPLADVVSDCVKRWFQDTLKEAKAGDTAMQVLVGQMFCSGYGVPKDTRKGLAWINRASKSHPSVWKVSDRHPGYLATNSESSDGRVKQDDIR